MRPIQLWLPTVGPSPNLGEVARDRERAFRAWQGESSVWLIPGLTKQVRWDKDGRPTLAIPGEHFDHLEVFHVSESGRIYGPSVNNYFPKGELDGLLKAWLNLFKPERIALHSVPNHFEMEVPVISSRGVRYCMKRITLEAAPFFPIYSQNRQTFDLQWPARGFPPTVSAEAEIRNYRSHTRTRAEENPAASESGHALFVQFLLVGPNPSIKSCPI